MLIRSFIFIFLTASALDAAPARREAYEPVPPPSASKRLNLFLNAAVSASGHWAEQTPARAVTGDLDVDDHWACEGLPVWHQVNLAEPATLSAIRVWPYWKDGRIYQFKVEGSIDGKQWKLLGDMSANSIAATSEGVLFTFDPVSVKHVRTTFLGNSRGANNGGHLVEIEGYTAGPQTDLAGGIGSTDLRHPPEGGIKGLRPFSEGIELHAWRGERVNAQLVLQSDASHQQLRFAPASVVSGNSRIPIEPRFVRYTLADGKPQGYILDHAETLPFPAGANRPVWITIDVPQDTKPGEYRGEITILSDRSRVNIPVRLRVLSATLPSPERWNFHLDLWPTPSPVHRPPRPSGCRCSPPPTASTACCDGPIIPGWKTRSFPRTSPRGSPAIVSSSIRATARRCASSGCAMASSRSRKSGCCEAMPRNPPTRRWPPNLRNSTRRSPASPGSAVRTPASTPPTSYG
jgi:hypothetical protein